MNRILKIQLSTLMFLQYFIWGGWFVSTGTYLLRTLAFSGKQVGLIYGTTAIAALVSPFFSGLLADRHISVERLLGIYHLAGGLLILFASYLDNFLFMYPVILMHTIFFIPTFGLANALVFHNVINITKEFSYIRVWGTIGWLVAGVTVSYLQWEELAYPMRMSAYCSLITAAFCFNLPKTPILQSKNKSMLAILGKEAKTLFSDRSFIVFLIGYVLIRIPSSFYYSFVNPFLVESGMSNPAGKMALGQFAEILLMLSFPFVYRAIGLKRMLVIGMMAWGVRYLFFAYGDMDSFVWMIYLGILLHGVTYNYTSHLGQIYIDQAVSPELRSSAQGFINFLTHGIGVLLGSFLAGYVVDLYTISESEHLWDKIFIVPGLIGIGITTIFMFFFHPKKQSF